MADLASDNFNRADGDSLGSNWTEQVGDFDILTNRAIQNTASGNNIATWDTNISSSPAGDYNIKSIVRCDVTGGAAVVGRWTASTDYYQTHLNTVSQDLRIRKRVADVATTLGTYVGGYGITTDYTIEMKMVGSTITAYEASTLRLTVTDSDLKAEGKPGLFADSDGKVYDDFLVSGNMAGLRSIFTSNHLRPRVFAPGIAR